MSTSLSDQPVIVTAERRAHPATVKLARALLALARHQLQSADVTTSHELPTADGQPEVGSRTEADHDK